MTNKKEKTPTVIRVPQPFVGLAYSFGWEQMKKFFLDLFLVTIIVGVVWLPLAMIRALDGRETPGAVVLQIFTLAYWLLLYSVIDYGSAFIFLKATRSEKFEVQDMFLAFQNYMNVVLANFLKTAIIAIGIFLLIVPGIIFACKLAFVKYLVLDRNMDPVEAVKESWNMTRGYAGRIFLLGLLAVPIFIAGLLCFIVGTIPAIMWIRSAFASMYFGVSEARAETA